MAVFEDIGASSPRLEASRHRSSGHIFFPKIPDNFPVAPEYETVRLSLEAILYSYTIVHPSPKSGQPSFVIAYADLPENVRIMGRMAGNAAPTIGGPLRIEVDEASEVGEPAYHFVPTA